MRVRSCLLVLAFALLLAATLRAGRTVAPATAHIPRPTAEGAFRTDMTASELLALVNSAHAGYTSLSPPRPPTHYLPPLRADEPGLTTEELDSLTRYDRKASGTSPLSFADAEADVDLLFRALRCTYGGYAFFGGDAAFRQAQRNVLQWSRDKDTGLTVGDLQRYLTYELRFIADSHFTVGGQTLSPPKHFFSDMSILFERDDYGFFLRHDGQRHYIQCIDGSPYFLSRLYLTLDAQGALRYVVGALGNTAKQSLSAQVLFDDGSSCTLTLTKTDLSARQKDRAQAPPATDIPIARICHFGDVNEQALLADARRIGESPVAILDLRGNGGGSPARVRQWLNAYDPQHFSLKDTGPGGYALHRQTLAVCGVLRRLAEAGAAAFDRYYYPGYDFSAQELAFLDQITRSGINTQTVAAWPNRRVAANSLLVVLVDKDTMSAGEHLVARLLNRDNVLFIGTNTFGATVSDKGIPIVLPHSGITVQYGSSLYLMFNESVVNEAMGFFPDLWVPEDALNRALQWICLK